MAIYIDVDVARRIIDSPRSKEQMLLVLSQVEPADVVEVVRCKDCRKWGNPHACPFGKRYMSLEDGYCYAGKRREDEI